MSTTGFFNLPQEIKIKKNTYQIIVAYTTKEEAEKELKHIKRSEQCVGIIRKGRIPGHKKSVFVVYA